MFRKSHNTIIPEEYYERYNKVIISAKSQKRKRQEITGYAPRKVAVRDDSWSKFCKLCSTNGWKSSSNLLIIVVISITRLESGLGRLLEVLEGMRSSSRSRKMRLHKNMSSAAATLHDKSTFALKISEETFESCVSIFLWPRVEL